MMDRAPADRRADDRRSRLLRQHRLVGEYALKLGETTDLPTLYQTIYQCISQLMTANALIVSSFDPDLQEIRAQFLMADGVVHGVDQFPVIPLEGAGSGIQSEVIRTGRPLNLPDFLEALARTRTIVSFSEDEGEPDRVSREEAERRITTRSAILAPMLFRGEAMGVIQVQSKTPADYSEEDVELLSTLANVSAVAIRNAELLEELTQKNRQLHQALTDALRAIALTTEIRDPFTAGHQRRVAQLACAVAERMGLEAEICEGLQAAALVHDMGKAAIPAEILVRPGRLNRVEMDLIRRHPTIGRDILETLESPWPLAEIVFQHHERLDGSGYPCGLHREEIRIEARILAVADVVEAMSSHRPYRPALGVEAALEEIERGRGTLYDSATVDVCGALFREDGFRFVEVSSPFSL
jgi:HD-GYP domain-containing protein (c-di-GMP phosphodiesterase class II)